MDLEGVLDMAGGFGLYQTVMFMVLGLTDFHIAFNILGAVFLLDTPYHRCYIPALDGRDIPEAMIKNLSIDLSDSKCKMYVRNFTGWTMEDIVREAAAGAPEGKSVECQHGWMYDQSAYISTAATQYDLVCNRKWLRATASSIFFAGLLVGVFGFGSVSDLIGRRRAILISTLFTVASTFSTAFAPNYVSFVILRFLVAASSLGLFTTAYVLMLEMVTSPYRVPVSRLMGLFWPLGQITMTGIAYFIRDHFRLQITYAAAHLIFLCYFVIAPESFRWLYVRGRTEEGEKQLRIIAKVNKKTLPDKIDIAKAEEYRAGTVYDLLRLPRMRYRTMNICFNWFSVSLVYYGLSLNVANLGGSPFLNALISAAVEIPAVFLSIGLLLYIGRRIPQTVILIAGGAILLLTLAVPTSNLYFFSKIHNLYY